MNHDDDLVTIGTYTVGIEAELARGLLQSNGIPVFLADEQMNKIAPHLSNMMGGMKLQVRRQDAALARQLLPVPAS